MRSRPRDPELYSIANMMEGRPDDDDADGWYAAVSRCDENRTANAAFHSSSRPLMNTRFPSIQTRTSAPPIRPTPAPPVLPSIPTSHVPAPMDVDATKRGGVQAMVCYGCGKTGHLRKDCPQGFDVRFMTEDERADWVQQLLASADLKEVGVHKVKVEEDEKAKEDFALDNE